MERLKAGQSIRMLLGAAMGALRGHQVSWEKSDTNPAGVGKARFGDLLDLWGVREGEEPKMAPASQDWDDRRMLVPSTEMGTFGREEDLWGEITRSLQGTQGLGVSGSHGLAVHGAVRPGLPDIIITSFILLLIIIIVIAYMTPALSFC